MNVYGFMVIKTYKQILFQFARYKKKKALDNVNHFSKWIFNKFINFFYKQNNFLRKQIVGLFLVFGYDNLKKNY